MAPRSSLRAVRLVMSGLLFAVVLTPIAASAAWPSDVAKIAVPTTRVFDRDVYGTAVRVAETTYPGFTGIEHVVIASGDDAALSDAAVASSLCWAYDAPLLLTGKKALPAATKSALTAIASANSSVTVHVVGSSASISVAGLAQIQSAAPTATVEQPWWAATSRYQIAASVAQRVREVAAQTGSDVPSVALVANGSDPKRLWDAASAAAVSRQTGIPLLLSGVKTAPASTVSAVAAAGYPRVIVVGGTGSVSKSVYSKLGASERWGGSTRFSSATTVANRAIANGYSAETTFCIASRVSNAVVGASLAGARGGVMLYTDTARLNKSTWSFLAPRASILASAFAVGGTSISEEQIAELQGAAAKPTFESGAPGRFVGKRFRVSGYAGGNTTAIAIYVRGKKVRTVAVKPWARFNVTSLKMPASTARVTAVAENPDGTGNSVSRVVKRLKYPSATCIVIDKSDFKLYWVKNNTLVKAYPIAIGRNGMETPAPATWKILAKYHTSWGSVYGPRKMRMFRLRGGRYVFTAYNIHGTNQEWVIGTKASHGCIRMYNRDVLKLFPQVPMGTMVYTRP